MLGLRGFFWGEGGGVFEERGKEGDKPFSNRAIAGLQSKAAESRLRQM